MLLSDIFHTYIFHTCLHNVSIFSPPSTVSLEGILRASHGLTHKFTGFYVTVERDVTDAKISSTKLNDDNDNVGTFHIISPAISKFSELCPNLITHTNTLPKSDVPVCLNFPPVKFKFSIHTCASGLNIHQLSSSLKYMI
jgi:hypothetical protein